eukprot:Nitzschia sp. Nitz4//scaffold282_size24342//21153//22040//NITZ4_008356-RA/size24342-processed-gene-0.35-mRNA-1//-1//CDS//3329545632//3239//frame0
MNPSSYLSPRDAFSLMNQRPLGYPFSKESEVAALSSLLAAHTNQQLLQQQLLLSSLPQQVTQKPKELELPQRFTKNGRKRATPFPLKLMKVLSDEQYSHVISWMPGGRSFAVFRPKAFVSDILPKHFKSAQFSSFTRKLARWGFTRTEDGTGEFYHPQFRRGRLDLAEQMTCQTGVSKAEEAKAEKNITSQDADTPSSEAQEQVEESSVNTSANQFSEMDAALARAYLTKNSMAMELEKMRLQQCMLAAAMSRKALASAPSMTPQEFAMAGGLCNLRRSNMDGFGRANIKGAKTA